MNYRTLSLVTVVFIVISYSLKANATNVSTQNKGIVTVNFGYSATVCINKSGDQKVDRKFAYFEARTELAAQVTFAIETVRSSIVRTPENNTTDFASQFEENIKSFSKTTLTGSRAIKQGYQILDDIEHYCVTMIMGDPFSDSKQFFDQMSNSTANKNEIENYQKSIAKYEESYAVTRTK
jgi:hypothetical protein